MPEGFPVLTLTVMRAICALMLLHPGPDGQEILVKVLDSLLPALWVDHKKVHEKDVFGPMLETIIGKSEVEKGLHALRSSLGHCTLQRIILMWSQQ